ncbi:uncharacterized protein LOC132195359 [Neocloeon triangulifer]|uniref:uncharacterized protein LOC132195359 n=1 Tax=Neocloeon triangulifer TaxID=2078957 RepID=UPI00286EE3E3|nr:uncharacterized protein LOC132195359 [Neocloeon triangulifer]
MVSQAKFSEMRSQFSNRDAQLKPPPPKKPRQKINLQYSQLNVQTVGASYSQASTLTDAPANPADTPKAEPDTGWNWSDDDDDIDTSELDALLSQYERPPDPLVQKQDLTIKNQREQPKVTAKPPVKVEAKNKVTVVEQKIQKHKDEVQKNDVKIIKKQDLKVNSNDATVSTTCSAVSSRKISSSKELARAEKIPESSEDVVDGNSSLLDFHFKVVESSSWKFSKSLPDEEYVNTMQLFLTEVPKTETLFADLFRELMSVPHYNQRSCIAKDFQHYWEELSVVSCESYGHEGARDISQQLQKLSGLLKTPHLISKLAISRTCEFDGISFCDNTDLPLVLNTPLILQQVAQICDIIAVRSDFFSFGPLICASINFSTSILLHQNNNDLQGLCCWILRRCAKIKPIPCVLISLVSAVQSIISVNPEILTSSCSHESSVACLVSEIIKNLTVIVFDENVSNGQRQKIPDQFLQGLRNSCPQKQLFASRVAEKLIELMSSLHFAHISKVPSCLSLVGSTECLKCIFALLARILIRNSVRHRPDEKKDELAARFSLVMWWLSSANGKFVDLTENLRAELYYFLSTLAKKKLGSLTGEAVNNLLSTYGTWSVKKNGNQEETHRIASESSTPLSPPNCKETLSCNSVVKTGSVDTVSASTSKIEAENASPKPRSNKKLSLKLRK